MLIFLFPSRFGDADNSTTSLSSGALGLFRVPLFPPTVLVLDLGVIMHSSDDEEQSPNSTGFGEGHQPLAFPAPGSSVGPLPANGGQAVDSSSDDSSRGAGFCRKKGRDREVPGVAA